MADVGIGQLPGQPPHLLGIHRPVVVGMPDVELPGRVHRLQVRAVLLDCGQIAAVKAGGRPDHVREVASHAQAEPAAHAVADRPDRPSPDLVAAAQEGQPRLRVGVQRVGGEARHLRFQHRKQWRPVLRPHQLLDVLDDG
jgi:hypothetical protein